MESIEHGIWDILYIFVNGQMYEICSKVRS